MRRNDIFSSAFCRKCHRRHRKGSMVFNIHADFISRMIHLPSRGDGSVPKRGRSPLHSKRAKQLTRIPKPRSNIMFKPNGKFQFISKKGAIYGRDKKGRIQRW